ncbi:thioredoxin fold domain-containing protein [Phormidium sp. CLA17]|uniref:thioredoxin family protein n=1 Tax=Leptolyngbya sp. Cla-17 TaxID=2803751 RepID=UPI001491F395|nr:thioredoxin family protein [Leptolyngbya sp. Cla-17]MBM0743748.1 thioredoxin fold domain-containing protein [Leptolyngbya sp. Cla-17]
MTGNSSNSAPDAPKLSTSPASEVTSATRLRNFVLALVAIALSVSIFLGFKTETAPGMLSAMAESAIPLETALSNGKPTLMEFYANWCTSCQAMATDLQALKLQYGDHLNFVMLNVDNNKWLPEVLKYRVDGIPHFVFLNDEGNKVAEAIGEQPRSIMEANLVALAENVSLPYAQPSGQTSAYSAPISPDKASKTDPRSHSSQVVN